MDTYESERTATREAAAATLREMADGLEAGHLRVGGESGVGVEVPDELQIELEVEREAAVLSVEVELEWPDPAGETAENGAVDDPETAAADTASSLARFEVFPDSAGEWRWRLVHRNGNVIATSGEGYTRKHNALKGLQSVMRNSPRAEIEESEG